MKENPFKALINGNASTKTGRTIFIGLLVINIVSLIVFTVFIFAQQASYSKQVYMINSSGDMFQIDKVTAKTYRPMEAKAHVRSFIELFYNLNKLNYENQILRALNLGGNDLVMHFNALKEKDYFTTLVKDNIIQVVENLELEMISTEHPYIVRAKFNVILEPDNYTRETYRISELFTVRNGSDKAVEEDKNPHNMSIIKLTIEDWTKMPNN